MANQLWNDVKNDIVTLTNRPELDAETDLAIKQATLIAHLSDKYPLDIVISSPVGVVSASTTDLTTSILVSPFSRFRDLAGVRLLDVDNNPIDSPEVDIVEARDIYDPIYRGIKKDTIAWLAGTNLNVHASCGMYGIEASWYQSPTLDSSSYVSWIAQNFSVLLVWQAAYIIWNSTGNEERAQEAYRMLHGDKSNPEMGLITMLKMNALNSAGR